MLRALAVLLLTTAPALAWEAKSGHVCELTHEDEGTRVRITYDPVIPEYAIAITVDRPWDSAPLFTMSFSGPRSAAISTDRHVISGGGATLSVTDTGFGNVLNGLEFNDIATAQLGDRTVAVALDGAGPAVRAFRACADGASI